MVKLRGGILYFSVLISIWYMLMLSNSLLIVAHPLDPLTSEEIQKAVSLTEKSKESPDISYIYNYIALKEPPKALMLSYFRSDTEPPTHVYPRKAFLMLIENSTYNVHEVVVNLNANRIESKIRVYGVRPMFYIGGVPLPTESIKSDARVQEKCAKLGYPNMTLVVVSQAYDIVTDNRGDKLSFFLLNGLNFKMDNPYAHPLDFFVAYDLTTKSILKIQDLPTHDDFSVNNEGNTAPKMEGNYDYTLRGGKAFLRHDDKPILVSSPEGVSYKIRGNEIQWQKWKMRVGFNGREGLILYTVNYNDGGTRRPILYRASLAEMFVPYGDPRPPYHVKVWFDIGKYGVGYTAAEQRNGEDVLGSAAFFDSILHDAYGNPMRYKNVFSVREEEAGILWKHVDFRTKEGFVVRSHRLVLSTIATVGNYDYGFNWEFYQDGSIQFVAQLTGIVSTNMMAVNATPAGHGTTMAPQVNAQYHQHFFTARLDMDVDGDANSVSTLDIKPVQGNSGSATNPYGQGFTTSQTVLQTVGEGRTTIDPLKGRTWVVTNPNSPHKVTNKPVGWKLMPHSYPPVLMKADSPMRKNAGFMAYDMWVTLQNDDQLYPGGFYLNNSGLPEWVRDKLGETIENKDIVLWHNFGLTHITRVEDYPIMPVETTGFWLKPFNFFKENPSIDVPPAGSQN